MNRSIVHQSTTFTASSSEMSAAAACAPKRIGATTTLTFAASLPEARGAATRAEPEGRCVHPQLWQACAGSLCAVPPVGAAVYYFPQGHAEHADAGATNVDMRAAGVRVPPLVACRVEAVRLMAERDTDDVYARIRLVPLRPWEPVADVGDALETDGISGGGGDVPQQQQKPVPASFAKTLTPSDANNSGAFSVPRFGALSVFPELDYTSDRPVQFVSATDVHGVEWTFRHVYRGKPRRHLLTTGWSNFVINKQLQVGDSVVFVREEDGKVHIGLRRFKRAFAGHGGGCGGNAGSPAGAASAGPSDGKVPAEDVVAAARLAATGQPFEVVHYPRASAPAFCVRAAAVQESMRVPWCPGVRFKMAFETEDVSRISWFMGTVAGVDPADPARWALSPWRLLQVTWDEPELLRNVNRVCPWRVEQVHISPPPPRKKPRTEFHSECRPFFDPTFPPDQPLPLAPPQPAPTHDWNHHGFVPSFPFPAVPDSIVAAAAASIQGARHPQFAPPFFSDPHFTNLQQSLLSSGILPGGDHQAPPAPRIATDLKIVSPTPCSPSPEAKKVDDVKPPPGIMLFGQSIQTEEQMRSNSSTRSSSSNTSDRSGSDVIGGSPTKNCPPTSLTLWWSGYSPASEFGLEPGQCKVFVESDAVGRNLDLSALGSFEELCARLSSMFDINDADLSSHVVYGTIAGEVKHVGDEAFSAFVKSARRITILSDAGSDNTGN